MLFKTERLKNKTKKSLVKSRRNCGFADLLGYALLLDQQTVLLKDGGLSCHFLFHAPDLSSATEAEKLHVSEAWKKALSYLGDGWLVETNLISQPYDNYHQAQSFPDRVSALIDDERRMHYQGQTIFDNRCFLSLSWKPSQLLNAKWRGFVLAESDERNKDSSFQHGLSQFQDKRDEFIGALNQINQFDILKGDGLVSFLHQCMTGSNRGLVKPYSGAFLDSYLACEDFIGGFAPKIGEKHISVIAIDDLPHHSYPRILEQLSYFPIAYRWSSRFISLDKQTAQGYLKQHTRNWSSQAIGVMGVIRESLGLPAKRNLAAQETADLAKQAQYENEAGHVDYGFYNSAIILMHEDKQVLQKITTEVKAAIQQLNFRARVESVNAAEAYLGSLPCHGDYNLRKILIDTQFVSHALPISHVYQGELQCSCPLYGENQPPLFIATTEHSRPFAFNLHVGDVGHTAIIGPTGMGKSTLVDLIIASHRRYEDSRVIVFDKDASHRNLIRMLGGQYLDASSNDFQLAPLAHVDSGNEQEITLSVEWLSLCCVSQGVEMSPERQTALQEAVQRLALDEAAYKDLDHLVVQEPKIREALHAINSGRFKHMLGGQKPIGLTSSVMGFDVSTLMETNHQGSETGIVVIQALFNACERLFQDKKPTLLILEEAWLYLRYPFFLAKLTDWFKTIRKLNVSVVFITQDIADVSISDAATIIPSSCMTRIYLANPAVNEQASYYKHWGLNENEVDSIRHATPKRDYYYQSERGKALFQLDLEEIALAFLCTQTKEDDAAFNAIYDANNPSWALSWLKHKGLYEWEDFARKSYFDGESNA